ncbi:MAG: HAD family hydrolase [Muribaculaceae bacterium]|nr:HAD family hydrolase [Muribaculaceae bacterium]
MLIIFDLDGTLLNTIADLAAAANYALEQCGYPTHSPEAYPYFVGNGVSRLLERVLPEDMRSQANVERMRRHFTEYYEAHLTDYTTPYPGIPELLHALRGRGHNVAVASNKYQAAVTRLIAHFFPDIEWAAVEGQKEGVPVKPDPSIVFGILSKCPTPKAQVLYVGDSGVDMTTAQRAAVTSVGVTWGFRPVKELREHYADNIASTPDDVLALADKIKASLMDI